MPKHATTVTTPDRGHNRRPQLFPLLFGLVDAHASRVDYLDTVGGDELMRLFRRRHPAHDHPRAPAGWHTGGLGTWVFRYQRALQATLAVIEFQKQRTEEEAAR